MTAALPALLALWVLTQLVLLWRERRARKLRELLLQSLLNVDDHD